MGDYGVLLYNAPSNSVPKSGKGANRIVGSGIAAIREFTGSTPPGQSAGSGSGTGRRAARNTTRIASHPARGNTSAYRGREEVLAAMLIEPPGDRTSV